MAANLSTPADPQLISFNTLRRIVGLLGISFPFTMIIGTVCFSECKEIQSSISIYYHTDMRNIFVGFLCAIALFLYSYKGYETVDNIMANLAGIFALGLAFIPTSAQDPLTSCIRNPFDNPAINSIHYVCAGGFLLSLAFFSLYLFRKGDKFMASTRQKRIRNRLYCSMGIIMLICMALIVIYLIARPPALKKLHPVFWLETIALICFGISWFVKGKTLLADEETRLNPPAYYQSVMYLRRLFNFKRM
jgi:hypothetical protein